MRRLRIGRLKWLLLPLFGPPLLWVLVLALVPTDWARRRIETALSEASGQEARLGAVRLGLVGEVELRALALTEPGATEPWLQADAVTLDVGLLRLAAGGTYPTRIEARGVAVVLQRRSGVGFAGCRLLRTSAGPEAGPATAPALEPGPEIAFRLAESRMTLRDEPTGAHIELTELEGRGTWRRHHAALDQLEGRLNGGPFELSGDLIRSQHGPLFEVELGARQVPVAGNTILLGRILPLLGGEPALADLAGTVQLKLYLRGRGDSAAELQRTLTGQGELQLDSVRLRAGSLLAELARQLDREPDAELGTARAEFRIDSGRIHCDPLVVEVGRLPLSLTGATDFQGRFDYQLKSEAFAALIAPELRSLVPELSGSVEGLLDVRIQGGNGPIRLTVNGVPLREDLSRPGARLRDAARRFRDRILR